MASRNAKKIRRSEYVPNRNLTSLMDFERPALSGKQVEFVAQFVRKMEQGLEVCGDSFKVGQWRSEKRIFADNATKFLKILAGQIGLRPSEFEVYFSAGGPAVSGEAYLVSDDLEIFFSADGSNRLLFFREYDTKTKRMGTNRFFEWHELSSRWEDCCDRIRRTLTRSRQQNMETVK